MKKSIIEILHIINELQIFAVIGDSGDLTPQEAIRALLRQIEYGNNYAFVLNKGNHILIYKPSAE
jgi:hypothetical protein